MGWTKLARVVFPAMIVLSLFAGCSNDPEPQDELPPGVTEGSPTVGLPTGTASGTPPVATVSTCENEATVVADPARQVGGSTSADVDGDEALDDVFIAADSSAPAECAAFIVARLATGETTSAPIWEIGRTGGLPQPRIHGMIDVDGVPGSEILVDEAAGASTQFVGVYVISDGDLVEVTVDGTLPSGSVAETSDLFAYGGSVGHLDAVDCADEGIVVSSATPSSDQDEQAEGIYDVERHFYLFEGSKLEREDVVREKLPVDEIDSLPEFGGSLFGSC